MANQAKARYIGLAAFGVGESWQKGCIKELNAEGKVVAGARTWYCFHHHRTEAAARACARRIAARMSRG